MVNVEEVLTLRNIFKKYLLRENILFQRIMILLFSFYSGFRFVLEVIRCLPVQRRSRARVNKLFL